MVAGNVSKDLLLKGRLSEETVELPGVGTVRVRGLSRREVLEVRKKTDDDAIDGPRALALERHMVAAAMVDPVLTEDDVAAWQEAGGAGELDIIGGVIQRLSGLDNGAPKEAYKSVRGRRR